MKWYLHKHHRQHLEDIKVNRNDPMDMYYSWVIRIANGFPKDNVAIGTLNLQDLVQAGYIGLVEAYNLLDHSKGQAEKWSYLKKRIKFAIRREIDNHGAFIKVPRRQLEENRKKMTSADKILVNMFPQFFDSEVLYEPDVRPWETERLSELLDDYLYEKFRNFDHIGILKARFGIDRDKPVSINALSKKYRISEIGVKKIKQRMITSLIEDAEFKKIIENFYKN